MAQSESQVAEELGSWRCRTREAISQIYRKGFLLAVQTILVLRAEDKEPKLFLALVQLEFQSFYRRVGW